MKNTLNILLKPVHPRKGFENELSIFLAEFSRKYERNRLFARIVFSLGCLAAFVPSILFLVQDSIKSGVLNYLSLIVSERTQVFVYSKELMISIVEAIPVLSLAIFLIILAIFIWSLVLIAGSTDERVSRNDLAIQ